MGGQVTRADIKEIGWVPVRADPTPPRGNGSARRLRVRHLRVARGHVHIPPRRHAHPHGETCANQAYVLDGIHLGMQCHVEVNSEMIETWCRIGISDIDQNFGKSPAVQDALTIRTSSRRTCPR
jgi:GMP synthase-like glutamine amidotransferase